MSTPRVNPRVFDTPTGDAAELMRLLRRFKGHRAFLGVRGWWPFWPRSAHKFCELYDDLTDLFWHMHMQPPAEADTRKRLAQIINAHDARIDHPGMFSTADRARVMYEALMDWQAELGGEPSDGFVEP